MVDAIQRHVCLPQANVRDLFRLRPRPALVVCLVSSLTITAVKSTAAVERYHCRLRQGRPSLRPAGTLVCESFLRRLRACFRLRHGAQAHPECIARYSCDPLTIRPF